MARQEFEFTLILSGVTRLTAQVLDAFFEAGCDDALIGMRDGIAYAEFCREADSFQQALFSAIQDVETAGVGAKVEHVEPDELVTMAEIARRLGISREGVRKHVAGLRGPGHFPPPAGSLTRRSPLWHWNDVIRWHQAYQQKEQGKAAAPPSDPLDLGPHIAVVNAALDLRRLVPLAEAMELLQNIGTFQKKRKPRPAPKVPHRG